MLNVAVAGLGWWGKIIVPQLKNSNKIKVLKVIDPNAAAIPGSAEFARANQVELVTDFQAILRDPAIQGVVLCTPHTLHTEQIIAAANAGKHVFCEKPLSMNRADVLRAIRAVNDNKVALAVGHERRFEPPIIEAMRPFLKARSTSSAVRASSNVSGQRFVMRWTTSI